MKVSQRPTPKGNPPASASPVRQWLLGVILVAMVVFAYYRAPDGAFIWDDDKYVSQNELLTAPDGLERIWFSLDSPSQYFPLTYTTFRWERPWWGLKPDGYHWTNILLHAANAVLLWQVLKRLRVPGCWLAAALFALHPVNVESVAWITERKNVLTLFCSLLSVLAWLRFVDERTKTPWRFYLLTLGFYLLALSAKTTACTLPAALLLILWWQRQRLDLRRLVQMVPFLAVGAGMGVVTIWWEHSHQGLAGKLSLPLLDRLLIASRAVWFYLGKLLWPANLSFSYPRWHIEASDPLAYAWLVALIALAVVIYFARRRVGRGVEVAAIFYVATLAPLLGFFMLSTFRYTFVADHYQYVAAIGPLALAAAGLMKLIDRFAPHNALVKPTLAGALLLALGTLTWRQTAMYADLETLWRTTIQRSPDSFMAHNNLGDLLFYQGQITESIEHYEAALKIRPEAGEVYYNLGNAFFRQGRLDDAINSLNRALEKSPELVGAHINLGIAYIQKGRLDQTIAQYEAALKLEPTNVLTLNNLSWVLGTGSDPSLRNGVRAIELAERADRLSGGNSPRVLMALAAAYAEAGRFPDAIATLQRTMQLPEARANAGLSGALRGQLEQYKAGQPLRDPTLATPPR